MYYSRFKNNEKLALAVAAVCWLGSLVYGWMPVLNLVLSGAEGGVGGELIMPSLLTGGSVLSVVWWRKSISGDQQLLDDVAGCQPGMGARVRGCATYPYWRERAPASTTCLGAE